MSLHTKDLRKGLQEPASESYQPTGRLACYCASSNLAMDLVFIALWPWSSSLPCLGLNYLIQALRESGFSVESASMKSHLRFAHFLLKALLGESSRSGI
jgi:hypothetical protein